jgi:predicted alpha/beta superfamily hydrolase
MWRGAKALWAAVLMTGPLLMTSSPAAAQAVREPTPIVIGQSFVIASGVMGENREINVWLPPGYHDMTRTYPVVYLLDGGVDQDFHHITGLAQLGTIVGTTQDFIVVGVATKDRRNELTFRAEHDPSLITDYPTHGQSGRFRHFIAEEVMPFIDATYRTDGDDALMGESLAGLFVVETFLRQPMLFERYIAISPSLWWDKGALADQAPALLTTQPPTGRILWLAVADEGGEMQASIDRLKAVLDEVTGYILVYSARPHETHATVYHPAALEALRILYAPADPTP